MLPTIFIVFGACFVLERLVPGWRLPHVRTWPLRVLAINAVQLGVVVLAGFTWERWLSAGSLFHLPRHLGPARGRLGSSSGSSRPPVNASWSNCESSRRTSSARSSAGETTEGSTVWLSFSTSCNSASS